MPWIILIIAAFLVIGAISWRKDTAGSAQIKSAPQSLSRHFPSKEQGKPYFNYTGDFYRICEALAKAAPFHEIEDIVIQVYTLDKTYCAVDFVLDYDRPIPNGITFGSGYTVSSNGRIEFKTKATDFSTPQLVKNMILQDMSSSLSGLQITVSQAETQPYGSGSLVICRFKAKYTH